MRRTAPCTALFRFASRSALCAFALGACATPLPILAGGSTVPARRGDVSLGGAVRVPVSGLDTGDAAGGGGNRVLLGRQLAPGGAVPAAAVRYGVTDDMDVGAAVAGSTGVLSIRGQLALPAGLSLVVGARPFLGYVEGARLDPFGRGDAVRGGLDVPAVLTVSISGLYEVWLGARLAVEHASGSQPSDIPARVDVSGTVLRTGGVAGLAVGFRRVHVLVELAVDHEAWWGSIGTVSFQTNGLVLTPAFALRLRL